MVNTLTASSIAESAIVGFRPRVAELTELHKLLLLCDTRVQSACVAELGALGLSVEVSKPGYVEAVSRGISKGSALLGSLLHLASLTTRSR